MCTAALALPAVAHAAPAAKPHQATITHAKKTVLGEVARAKARHAITPAQAASYRATYLAAHKSYKGLTGARKNELGAVLNTISTIAAAGKLTVGRMPLGFETVKRNRQWWTTGSLLSYGQRITFKGSSLIWQSYPGQGIQLQWLGTFGKANSYMSGGRHTFDKSLSSIIDEATALAAPRAGGIAWESWFTFDGGRPPWVSALSQGTGLQVFSRAASHLKRPELLKTAKQALGVFQTAPPTGTRVKTGAGAQQLIYSFAPNLLVLNAFTQATNGLHDYALYSKDPEGQKLYLEAEAELRKSVPRFDTGAWSLYSLAPRESDLSYHTLLRDFLKGTCDRTTADRKRAEKAGEDASKLPDPAIYCAIAARFTADLTTPPVLDIGSTSPAKPKHKKALAVAYSLSKISTVSTSVTRAGKGVAGRTVVLAHGGQAVRFTPAKSGDYVISIRATDLAGNVGRATKTVHVG